MAFKVGIVGLGMAVTPHAKSLLDLKLRVEVAHAFSPSAARRRKFGALYGFKLCANLEAILEDHIEDDLLRLVFTACHPVLTMDARVTLTLRLLGGLKTDEIARAFLAPEPTIAQRIVRAKRNLAKANVQFEVPAGDELLERLSAVLEVVYLIYNEGYSATAGGGAGGRRLGENSGRSTIVDSCSRDCAATGFGGAAAGRSCT